MNQHPEEMLAAYVDGALGPEEGARLEEHVAACARCREEVALAREATAALAALPHVDAPFGLTRDVVRGARRPGLWSRPWTWAAAGAAAAVIGAFAFLTLGRQPEEPSEGSAAAPSATATAEAADQAPEAALTARGGSAAGYPVFREVEIDYTRGSLERRARELAAEARAAEAAGFPGTAADFYATVELGSLDAAAGRALECATSAVPPERNVVPFVLEAARFEGIPAYVVSFLLGPGPEEPYDRVQLLVVDRETCTIRHFARQRL